MPVNLVDTVADLAQEDKTVIQQALIALWPLIEIDTTSDNLCESMEPQDTNNMTMISTTEGQHSEYGGQQ